MSEKKCSNCFKIKPVSAFYPKRYRSGYTTTQSRCKDCNAEVVRGYMRRKKGIEDCDHFDLEEGICLDCGLDRREDLMCAAYDRAKDRD